MPSAAITDADERQTTPPVLAAELGWTKGFGLSWDALLDLAEMRYWRAREQRMSA